MVSETNLEASRYVPLIAGDGRVFYVLRECASVSRTLRCMLEYDFVEARRREIALKDIDSDLLEWCCDYFYYYRQCEAGKYGTNLPEFDVPLERALELLTVANYLDL